MKRYTSLSLLLGLSLGLSACCERNTCKCSHDEEETPVEAAHQHDHGGAAAVVALPELSSDARVFFVSPEDGAVVKGPLVSGKVEVKIEMGAKGVSVEPAGEIKSGSGHHHILVDAEAVPKGETVPADEQHIHYGQGQTEATLSLTPGKHRLSLQLADGIHRSYGSALTSAITIEVEAEAPAAD